MKKRAVIPVSGLFHSPPNKVFAVESETSLEGSDSLADEIT
jgi:hypothetical protein